jgi:hypothetical protein
VYLLLHTKDHESDDIEDWKLLGVYSTRERARTRSETARLLPGFRLYPNGFLVEEWQLDDDGWSTGFATMTADNEWVPDPDPD